MQWAGFPSVDRQQPRRVVFAGQQFTLAGYDQNQNYIYIADNSTTPATGLAARQALADILAKRFQPLVPGPGANLVA